MSGYGTTAAGERRATGGDRRTMAASLMGTVVEWYDFNLYGLASALVFGPLIFGSSSVGGTLAAFATFGVGFAARPIGGMILGNFGDRVGRKRVLQITMFAMGISTTLLGLLPTHAQIGLWAPVLLVLLRTAQGFAVGGEFAVATLLTIEKAPSGRRGLHGAVPSMGTGAGFVFASVIFGLVSLLPEDAFLSWGWRVPFLISFVLVLIGIWLRHGIEDTPAFTAIEKRGEQERFPLLSALRTQPRAVIRTIGITVSGFVFGYMLQAFSLNYGVETVGVSRSIMLWAIACAAALEIATIPFWGWISDKIGRKRTITAGLILTVAFIVPFFAMLDTGNPVLIFAALIIALPIAKDMVHGPQAAFVAELFDPHVRASGVSAGREIGGALFGGTAPFVATALLAGTGSTHAISGYVVVACVITLVAALTGKETAREDLDYPTTRESHAA